MPPLPPRVHSTLHSLLTDVRWSRMWRWTCRTSSTSSCPSSPRRPSSCRICPTSSIRLCCGRHRTSRSGDGGGAGPCSSLRAGDILRNRNRVHDHRVASGTGRGAHLSSPCDDVPSANGDRESVPWRTDRSHRGDDRASLSGRVPNHRSGACPRAANRSRDSCHDPSHDTGRSVPALRTGAVPIRAGSPWRSVRGAIPVRRIRDRGSDGFRSDGRQSNDLRIGGPAFRNDGDRGHDVRGDVRASAVGTSLRPCHPAANPRPGHRGNRKCACPGTCRNPTSRCGLRPFSGIPSSRRTHRRRCLPACPPAVPVPYRRLLRSPLPEPVTASAVAPDPEPTGGFRTAGLRPPSAGSRRYRAV